MNSITWPYILPSIRDKAPEILYQFQGAVKTRILQRQKALWSRFIGTGFTAEDIEYVWPEEGHGRNQFFAMRYAGHTQSMRLEDLNLRELDELDKWLTANIPAAIEWAKNPVLKEAE